MFIENISFREHDLLSRNRGVLNLLGSDSWTQLLFIHGHPKRRNVCFTESKELYKQPPESATTTYNHCNHRYSVIKFVRI